MSINKIFIYLFLITMILSCGGNEGGGGVFVEPDAPKEDRPTNPNPPDDNDNSNPPPVDNLINSSELEQLVDQANPGDIISLTDSEIIFLDESVNLDKPITIQGSINNNKVLVRDEEIAFNILSDNVNIQNLNFELLDGAQAFSTPVDSEEKPIYKNLRIENSVFYLRGKSNLRLSIDNLTFIKSNIFGLETNPTLVTTRPMVFLIGENINFAGNLVFDVANQYVYPMQLLNTRNVNFTHNLIKGKSAGAEGLLTINSSSIINIESNIFSASNPNNAYFADEANTILVQGSIAVSSNFSDQIFDNGQLNTIFTVHQIMERNFPFDNAFNNIPINNFTDVSNQISFGQAIRLDNAIENLLLFEENSNFQAADEGNIRLNCEFPENLALSDLLVPEWNFLEFSSGSKLYYVGAISPTCSTSINN